MKTRNNTKSGGKELKNVIQQTQILWILMCFFAPYLHAQPQTNRVPKVSNPQTQRTIELRFNNGLSQGKSVQSVASISATPSAPGVIVENSITVNGGTKRLALKKGTAASSFQAQSLASPQPVPSTNCTNEKRKVSLDDPIGFIMNPNQSLIYPGAIYDGSQLVRGGFTPIPGVRTPAAIVTTLPITPPDTPFVIINSPSQANVFRGIQQLLNKPRNAVNPANQIIEVKQIKSQEELNIKFNVFASSMGNSLNNVFQFNERKDRSYYIASFYQIYYSMYFNPPVNGGDFFVTPPATIPEHWTYVGAVNYGRIGMLAIQVENKDQNLINNLEAKIGALFTNARIDASINSLLKSSSFRMQGLYLGGNPNTAGQIIGSAQQCIDKFKAHYTEGSTFGPNSPGVPISYSMYFVKDGSLANIGTVMEYNLRQCETKQKVQVSFDNIFCQNDPDQGPNLELFGNITIRAFNSLGTQIPPLAGLSDLAWEKKENDIQVIKKNQTISFGSAHTFEVFTDEINSYFQIGIQLNEKDDDRTTLGGRSARSDNLGYQEARILYSDLARGPKPVEFIFKDGDGGVMLILRFTIKKA